MELIKITKQSVENTKVFEGLDSIQRTLVLRKNIFEQIRLGVNLVRAKGMDLYKQEHKPNDRVLAFVKELSI